MGQEKAFELSDVELLDIKTVIVCIYRSPESDLDEFLAKLEFMIRRIQEHTKKRLIICGDWNVNFLHNNSNLHKVQNILEIHNLINMILTPTRLSRTSCSLIHVTITEGSNHAITISNIDLEFSDHKAQILYQRLDEPAIKVIHKAKWYFTKENREQFNLTLKEEQWENVCISDEANTSYQTFLVILYYYFNSVFPLKRPVIKNKPYNAWISKGILKSRNRMLFLQSLKKSNLLTKKSL
jgi:hypothetical protein